ncbi:MAG: MFS transporter, partial [Sphaerobacter sp.]|nr:MFS transporter [Sphaerobacter sp.]
MGQPTEEDAGRRGRARQSVARMFSSFRNRNYRLYWFGQLLSVTGTWIQRVAQAWLVLNLTDSSFALGLVTTLQFLPLTIFALVGGLLADRLPKRQVLIVTQAVMAVQALILGLLISAGTIQIWHIYLLAAVLGLATAFDNPTRQAFVVEMVGPKDVANAVALNSSLFNAARIVGPAIGGALIASVGIAFAFYANAASYLGVIGGLLLMRPSEFHDVPPPVRGPVLTRLREGIAFALQTPPVALVLILMAFLGTFGYQFTVILPLIARYVLDTSALGLGGLLTAMGIGSLVAALGVAYASRPTERLLLVGATGFTLLLGLLAVSRMLGLTLAILVLLGAASIIFT